MKKYLKNIFLIFIIMIQKNGFDFLNRKLNNSRIQNFYLGNRFDNIFQFSIDNFVILGNLDFLKS